MSSGGRTELPVRIVLVQPPPHCDFGVQRGKGSDYETVSVQQFRGTDLVFDFSVTVEDKGNGSPPNFIGPFAQGPSGARFIYIDVGSYAGQRATPWARRIKVPLAGISWSLVKQTLAKKGQCLSASIPGTGKDGGPSCATVRPIAGWKVEA